MREIGRWCGALLACATLATLRPVAVTGQPQPEAARRVDFNTDVRPLLSDRCFRCHGPDAAKRKAKLRLDIREGAMKALDAGWAVITPHDPAHSELIRRIYTDDDDDLMPPSDSHLSLSSAEKETLRTWVAQGAEYRAHWSLEPVQTVPVPADATRDVHPIDALVRTRLTSAGLAPASRAEPETLLRRVALTLTGLPPTLDELDAFVANSSPEAYAQVVAHYLASPAYGERMAGDWLDLARYADTYGYQADVERDMSPYRDWVIRAFNDNMPYDQFLTWQLAGDLLPNATRDQRIATAFNRLHRQTNEGGSIEEEYRVEYVLDRVNTFGTAMLGLTVECARCHDHKFDPITQRDYYALSAFFNSIDESGLYSHFTNATPSPSMLLWPAHAQSAHDEFTSRLAASEARVETIADEAREVFDAWMGRPAASMRRPARRAGPTTPAPVAHLTFARVENDTTPDLMSSTAARLQDGPALISDTPAGAPVDGAMRFNGDNAVVHPGVPIFGRTDAFSIAIRLQPTEHQARAIVLHQSRAWTDAGSRGFELTLEDGRPFFGLIHFWPGNAIAVKARDPLPLNHWSRVVVTYDGSSRADGIRLYVDGRRVATTTVRDRLYKDITYDRDAGDQVTEAPRLTLGARFRDSGFRNGIVDDLQVFDEALTALEVAGTPARQAADADAFQHFLVRHHVPMQDALAARAALRAEENRVISRVPELMVMEELPEPRPAHLLARGAYDAPGEVVPRDTPSSLPPFPSDQPRNRLGLARWLTDPGHPLTARVVVNRIWRMHFGHGLVATPDDFGNQGSLPTHPELLDWLAQHFMRDGWDVKALHALILTSDTFQQASQADSETTRRDPENRLLARGPKGRLTAEQIRDSALAASGLLTRTMGGPSVKPYQPAGLWEQSGTGKTYTEDTGDNLYRRSVYTFWRRTSPPPSMATFDAPTREVCTARRETTLTPLQSLVLLNDPQFVEAARALAQRLLERYPDDAHTRHRDAFRTLTGRTPDEAESAILARHFAEQRALFAGTPDDATRLLGVGASAWNQRLPPLDLAATTAVVSLIMNVDEFSVAR